MVGPRATYGLSCPFPPVAGFFGLSQWLPFSLPTWLRNELPKTGPNYYGARYTQLGGWIDPKAPAPFVSAAIVRAELPGRPPFAVERVSLDQSNAGMPKDYLKAQWPTGRETPC